MTGATPSPCVRDPEVYPPRARIVTLCHDTGRRLCPHACPLPPGCSNSPFELPSAQTRPAAGRESEQCGPRGRGTVGKAGSPGSTERPGRRWAGRAAAGGCGDTPAARLGDRKSQWLPRAWAMGRGGRWSGRVLVSSRSHSDRPAHSRGPVPRATDTAPHVRLGTPRPSPGPALPPQATLRPRTGLTRPATCDPVGAPGPGWEAGSWPPGQ